MRPGSPEPHDGGRTSMSDDPKLEELDKLISTGKQKGYVTYEELNDALPGDLISSYQLDDIMLMFGAMDIDVVDSAKAPRPLNEIEDSLDEREEAVQAEGLALLAGEGGASVVHRVVEQVLPAVGHRHPASALGIRSQRIGLHGSVNLALEDGRQMAGQALHDP